MAEPTLYERLGGIYAIAAVVDHFSDQLLKNPKIVDANPELKEWHTVTFAGRLRGLKFLRTLWVASLAGGPFQYTARELRDAHFDLKIPPEVFDEVDAELGRSLAHFGVPEHEKGEVLAAFGGWKDEVTAGSKDGAVIGVVGVEPKARTPTRPLSSPHTQHRVELRDELGLESARRGAEPWPGGVAPSASSPTNQ